jgi:FeS assembly SUF system protein
MMLMVTEEEVLEVLRECYDPEIPINIVDLGLVYKIEINGDKVYVQMTLTAPGCPVSGYLKEDVTNKLLSIKGVKEANVDIVWEPVWTPDKMSEDAKRQLGWLT